MGDGASEPVISTSSGSCWYFGTNCGMEPHGSRPDGVCRPDSVGETPSDASRWAFSLATQSSRYLTYSIEACVKPGSASCSLLPCYVELIALTCRIASLCISPVHAGIMPFSTANSSFILDRRRRSIKLCAVFLAIFRPAALVADGCFFLDCSFVDAAAFAGPDDLVLAGASSGSSCGRGFI